jgi:hypothetical protein
MRPERITGWRRFARLRATDASVRELPLQTIRRQMLHRGKRIRYVRQAVSAENRHNAADGTCHQHLKFSEGTGLDRPQGALPRLTGAVYDIAFIAIDRNQRVGRAGTHARQRP